MSECERSKGSGASKSKGMALQAYRVSGSLVWSCTMIQIPRSKYMITLLANIFKTTGMQYHSLIIALDAKTWNSNNRKVMKQLKKKDAMLCKTRVFLLGLSRWLWRGGWYLLSSSHWDPVRLLTSEWPTGSRLIAWFLYVIIVNAVILWKYRLTWIWCLKSFFCTLWDCN